MNSDLYTDTGLVLVLVLVPVLSRAVPCQNVMRVLVSTSGVGSAGPRSGLGEALTGLKRMMVPVGVGGGGADGPAVWTSAPEVTSETPEAVCPTGTCTVPPATCSSGSLSTR